MKPRSRDLLPLALFVAVCLAVGGASSIVTASSVRDWYPLLAKPSWTPPGWLFGPVWTVLYVMIGVSGWLAYRDSSGPERSLAMGMFAMQLALNAIWSVLFFGLKQPGHAALEIACLWLAIVFTMVVFQRIRPLAAWLLFPYLGWVSFASALNTAIWDLNR